LFFLPSSGAEFETSPVPMHRGCGIHPGDIRGSLQVPYEQKPSELEKQPKNLKS